MFSSIFSSDVFLQSIITKSNHGFPKVGPRLSVRGLSSHCGRKTRFDHGKSRLGRQTNSGRRGSDGF